MAKPSVAALRHVSPECPSQWSRIERETRSRSEIELNSKQKGRCRMGDLYKAGERCFGADNMKRWLKAIERHYESEPAFTALERKLRDDEVPTKNAAMDLLEDAVNQTLRGILGIRTGRRRRQPLPRNLKIECRDVALVMEGY
jgi:hypothetical protein